MNVALMSVLLAWLVGFGIRGSRCATLLACDHQVTVRGLVVTTSVQRRQIDRFVAGTRLVPMMGPPSCAWRTHLPRPMPDLELSAWRSPWLAHNGLFDIILGIKVGNHE